MTYAADEPLDPELPRPNGVDRSVAMFSYLCLFFTVFFLGVPAFIALILAHLRRDEVDRLTRSHLDFQIRIFWWAFGLSLVSGLCLIAALVLGIGRLIVQHGMTWTMPDGRLLDGDLLLWGLTIACIVAGLLACLWTWLGALWGAMKLASGRPIGRV